MQKKRCMKNTDPPEDPSHPKARLLDVKKKHTRELIHQRYGKGWKGLVCKVTFLIPSLIYTKLPSTRSKQEKSVAPRGSWNEAFERVAPHLHAYLTYNIKK